MTVKFTQSIFDFFSQICQVFYKTIILTFFYNWFLLSKFNLPSISWIEMLGITMFVNLIIFKYNFKELLVKADSYEKLKIENSLSVQFISFITIMIVYSLEFSLGYLIHSIIN